MKIDQAVEGVIFDPHYTDSLLRCLSRKAVKHDRIIKARQRLSRKEVLTNLLLFGRAYLSRPFWLKTPELPDLGVLEREDLATWIPSQYYEGSLEFLENYSLYLASAYSRLTLGSSDLSLEHALDIYGEPAPKRWRRDLIRQESEIDASMDMLLFALTQLMYNEPLTTSVLRYVHLDLNAGEKMFLFPIETGSFLFNIHSYLPIAGIRPETRMSWVEKNASFCRRAAGSYIAADYVDEFRPKNLSKVKAFELMMTQAAAFDASLAKLAIESFAGKARNPVKANAPTSRGGDTSFVLPPAGDVYRLVEVQFKNLRYPVIETIDDVLRLRDDPYLRNYREVIFGYSREIQAELEAERVHVLEHFKHDMELALSDLSKLRRWSRYLDITFYLSIPLAIVGALVGLPLSDILAIPVGGLAKVLSNKNRRKHGWLLFGRSETVG